MQKPAVFVVLLMLVVGCGGGGLSEATGEASAFLRRTADDLFPGLPREESPGDSGCREVGKEGFAMHLNIELGDGIDKEAIVERTAVYWNDMGYEAEVVVGAFGSIARGESSGMVFSFKVAGETGFLRVDTACY